MNTKRELIVESKKVGDKLIAIGSTEAVDRMGDVVLAEGWDLKNFKKNPVLMFAHNYSEPPIGYAKNIKVVDKQLIFEPVFHNITQLAREISAMYTADPAIMSAWSVGFIPKEFDPQDYHRIINSELLEISAVPVPANQEALMMAAKSFNAEEEKSVHSWFEKMNKEIEVESKGVVPFTANPTRPEETAWDANSVTTEVWGDGSNQAKYAKLHAWFDETQNDDDSDGFPDVKSAYKLPHHDAGLKVVWRGVAAAMAALLGARGGVSIPDSDKGGVYNHLAKHYAQFDKTPPEMKEYTEAELKAIEDEPAVAEKQEEKKEINPMELAIEEMKLMKKEGRVLSKKTLALIDDAIYSMTNAVSTLQELQKNAVPEQQDGEVKQAQGRTVEVQKLRKNRVTVRALQKIAKNINEVLRLEKQN